MKLTEINRQYSDVNKLELFNTRLTDDELATIKGGVCNNGCLACISGLVVILKERKKQD